MARPLVVIPTRHGSSRYYDPGVTPVRRAVASLRARAATTPGLLRLLSVGLVVVLLLLWLAAFTTTTARQRAVGTVRDDAGPAFVLAQRIHADLSVADATVARAFLAGGIEPAEQRAAYDRSISSAAQEVVDLARAGGPPEVEEPLATLAREIPVYTGLVERARTNNRSGNVVGAAYLRQASARMQNTILPAATSLAAIDAARIDSSYESATFWIQPWLLLAVGLAGLAGLVAVQVLLYRRTHRVLNVPLVAATVLVAVATSLTLAAFATERSRLAAGHDDGFEPMTLVAQARVLALRAWGDESLALIARGNGAAFDNDAVTVGQRLGYDATGAPVAPVPPEGVGPAVLPAVMAAGGPDAPTRSGLDAAWRTYQATSIAVRKGAGEAGGFQDAVNIALHEGTDTFNQFDQAADVALTASERRFDSRVSAASDSLAGLEVIVSICILLAAGLAVAGIQMRINEYR